MRLPRLHWGAYSVPPRSLVGFRGGMGIGEGRMERARGQGNGKGKEKRGEWI